MSPVFTKLLHICPAGAAILFCGKAIALGLIEIRADISCDDPPHLNSRQLPKSGFQAKGYDCIVK
jgi:hypothetical protein